MYRIMLHGHSFLKCWMLSGSLQSEVLIIKITESDKHRTGRKSQTEPSISVLKTEPKV